MSARLVWTLSLLLVLLVFAACLTGIAILDFYHRETLNWKIQSIGQDVLNLTVVLPAFVLTLIFSVKFRGHELAIRGGIILYLLYTYVIYCFDVHFNELFLIYCFILGLSFFLFVRSMFYQFTDSGKISMPNVLKNILGLYFIIISTLFYLLWVIEITSSILDDSLPKVLIDAGLPTNPVHILDISVVLPGIFITGILLLKGNSLGYRLAPMILVFFILMDITIAALNFMLMQIQGSPALSLVMLTLAGISLILLIVCIKKTELEKFRI